VRTTVGAFRLEDAAHAEGETPQDLHNALRAALRPLDRKLFHTLEIPCIAIDKRAAADFVHGKPLANILPPETLHDGDAAFAAVFKNAAHGEEDRLLGVIERREDAQAQGGKWAYWRVFN
jgi:hypothetical protein